VSKSLGPIWRGRIDQAVQSRKDAETNWDEAIRYYLNDQMSHRTADGVERAGNLRNSRYNSDNWSETENVVFSNTCTVLPMVYAKNPSVEITARDNKDREFCESAKCVINFVLQTRESPGINLKPKARRGILTALLTNRAWLKVGFTEKVDSSEQAVQTLNDLANKYVAAKSKREIEEIEGQIAALEGRVDMLSPAGPTVKLIHPKRLVVPSTTTEPDASDAPWLAEYDFLPTNFLKAMFGKEKEDSNAVVSIFEPTHILTADGDNSADDDVNNFTLFSTEASPTKAGYKSDAAFQQAQYTKVWYVWDKTTRRVYLFMDNYFKWPLWVWDDPLKLLDFFPYVPLWFHEAPEGSQPKGETTYYLDQQDAINEIHDEVRRARRWAKNNWFYNKSLINKDDAEKIIKGADSVMVGIDLPADGKITDAIQCAVPPSISHPELFDTTKRFDVINRITGISNMQRGAEFKVNTTNEAVQAYQSNANIRVDEKIDAIEDWIGTVAWKLLQILVQKWSAADVTKYVGAYAATNWRQINDPSELRTLMTLQVVGGSTDKPTSKVKKQEALQIGQVIGQFGQQIPAAGIFVIRALEQAFENFVMSDQDWEMLMQSMTQQANGPAQQPTGQPGGAPPGRWTTTAAS
jgi:hypothetical protein